MIKYVEGTRGAVQNELEWFNKFVEVAVNSY
jgi:hypothetical protein